MAGHLPSRPPCGTSGFLQNFPSAPPSARRLRGPPRPPLPPTPTLPPSSSVCLLPSVPLCRCPGSVAPAPSFGRKTSPRSPPWVALLTLLPYVLRRLWGSQDPGRGPQAV